MAKGKLVEVPCLVLFVKLTLPGNAVRFRNERGRLYHDVHAVVGDEADLLGGDPVRIGKLRELHGCYDDIIVLADCHVLFVLSYI